MKKLLLFGLLGLGVLKTNAQDDIINVGTVKKVSWTGSTLDLTTSNAYVRLVVYSPSVIRVRIDRKPFDRDFSYAVNVAPDGTSLQPVQTAENIEFTTALLKVQIRKNPFSIRFLTADGNIINEDEQGLETSWIGTEVTAYKHLQQGERFIGLGEKTGNLDRRGSAYTNWNTDIFGYSTTQDPLYTSIPFYIGVVNGLQYGIFLDNTAQTEFNFGASNNRFSSFAAKAGELNYYFIYKPTVAGIIEDYTWLTGRMKMPPLWSLGYQQNRYSYYPETEVYRIAQTLREKKIPADGITLDIHYMDSYKLFTWDKDRFPQPEKLIDSLQSMGFKTTLIVDPGIKVEKDYPAYESGLKEDIFIKYADGKPYTGEVWPGWCHFPDFTSEKGRNWWHQQLKNYTSIGVAGIWNDMNEISTWGQKMPNNIFFDYDGKRTTHLKAHNVYGMQMARASFEGVRKQVNTRPFILTRAGYAGLQRYTALWTGDNRSEDDHMLTGVRLMTSLGLSGVAFTAMDIGGFTGNPTVGLYNRWMQLGAFLPYFRNHTQFDTKSSEPWTMGETVLNNARNYINLRYRLLPYLYSTFHEATISGLPVMRSLAIDYTHDQKIYEPVFQNQYLLGNSLLIIPQESIQHYAKIYLPAGEWYNLYTDEYLIGKQEQILSLAADVLPVYIKAGSIIPMQSLVQSTSEKPTDTLTLHIYNGKTNKSFFYYEDDGNTYSYEDGDFYKRAFHFNALEGNITLAAPTGKRSSHFKQLRLVFHGFKTDKITINNNNHPMQSSVFSYLHDNPDEHNPNSSKVKIVHINNTNDKITIGFEN